MAGGRREAWRWRATALYTPQRTIQVIEPPAREDADDADERVERKVPFGFGVRDEVETAPVEPLLWEGDDA